MLNENDGLMHIVAIQSNQHTSGQDLGGALSYGPNNSDMEYI